MFGGRLVVCRWLGRHGGNQEFGGCRGVVWRRGACRVCAARKGGVFFVRVNQVLVRFWARVVVHSCGSMGVWPRRTGRVV